MVDEKGYITILNEEFYINKTLCFEYVWAILNAREQGIKIYYQAAPEAPKQLIRTELINSGNLLKTEFLLKNFAKCRRCCGTRQVMNMKNDIIVEEVRQIRNAHAAKFNYDLKAICKDIKTKERDRGHPLVSFPPKLLSNVTRS